jgi:uncharacterized membrane protein YkoI
MRRLLSILVASAALAGAAAPAAAQGWGDPYGGRDQDRARAAVQGGQVLPLESILQSIARRWPGQVLSAAGPMSQGGAPVYRILWDSRGRQIEFIVDARSGAILQVNGG